MDSSVQAQSRWIELSRKDTATHDIHACFALASGYGNSIQDVKRE